MLLGPAVVLQVRVISSPLLSVTFGAGVTVTKFFGETKITRNNKQMQL